MSLLTRAEWDRLFENFAHTAFRLETRDQYRSAREAEALRQFVADEPVDMGWFQDWLGRIRRLTAEGYRITRVRVVTLPLTDYSRFGVFCSGHTNAAGEDIRYLPRDEAGELPDHDYWLFDSCTLARMHFDDEDTFLGAEIVTDPAAIVQANYWRDAAWHHARLRETFAEG